MPQIIIRERSDRTGPVKLTLGSQYKEIPRNKQIEVTDGELSVLMNSHEANHIFVVPSRQDLPDQSPALDGPGDLLMEETGQPLEETDVAIDRTQRADADPGGYEAGVGPGRKLRRTGPGAGSMAP